MIQVGERQVAWEPGMTVASLLEKLEDGGFYAVVRLNGKLVSRPNFSSTPLPDGATVELIPMVAGG